MYKDQESPHLKEVRMVDSCPVMKQKVSDDLFQLLSISQLTTYGTFLTYIMEVNLLKPIP